MSVATHEAAHTVSRHTLGYEIGELRFDNENGFAHATYYQECVADTNWVDEIICCLAGSVGQCIHVGYKRWNVDRMLVTGRCGGRADDDFREASDAARMLMGFTSVKWSDQYRREQHGIEQHLLPYFAQQAKVLLEANWHLVVALAEALDASEYLSSDDIYRIIENAQKDHELFKE